MYFEDYVPGNVSRLRTDTFSEASIIEFARQYDPQEFRGQLRTVPKAG
jgi:hypothetical protein